MKIVVLVKTATGGAVDREDGFDRAARTLPGVLGPFDAHAVEEALRRRGESGEGEVVVVAMAASTDVLGGLRDALAMGADSAVLVADPAIDDVDLQGRSKVLATLLSKQQADLYLCCPWSGDIDGTLLWASVAAHMGLPMLSQVRSLDLSDRLAKAGRQTEWGDAMMSAGLPCMIELTEAINKARRPTMPGRVAAKRKPISLLSFGDMGLAEDGLRATSILSLTRVSPSRQPVVVNHQDDAPQQILSFIKARGLLS